DGAAGRHERPARGTRRLRQLGRGRVGPPDSVLPVPSSGAVRIMAGPDAHGAQSAEQSITVDSLHSPPNRAGTAGARQGDPGPVHRVITGGGRHDRPAARPTDRRGSVPPSTGGGTLLPPNSPPPLPNCPPPLPPPPLPPP